MFLTVRNVNGYPYLYLMKSVWNEKKQANVNEIAFNYGRYDELDPKIRKAFEDEKQKKILTKKLAEQFRNSSLAQASLTLQKTDAGSEDDSPSFNRLLPLRYGHLALKPLWEKELGLKYKIDYLQKTKTSFKTWRLNDVLFYVCALKLIDPGSYFSAVQRKSDFFYCPWNSVAQDNFYRALDFVYEHREALLKHAVKHHLEKEKRQIKVAFFDCTNTWFETPYDDLAWQIMRFNGEVVQKLEKEGKSRQEIEAYLASEDFARLLAEHLELNQEEVLRMRGKSKECRFAQPLVTVALAIDQTGFPIDCKVFAGNLAEIRTIEPMLESLKNKYAVKDVYFVADRGLNSAEKLEKIKEQDLGFVVAQKVSRQKKIIRAEMLDLAGYRNFEQKADGSFLVSAQKELNPQSFRFKVCPHAKEYKVQDESGKTVKKSVDCKIIYTFSPARQKRDLIDLENQIAKAQHAIESGLLLGNQCGSGWRSLLQTKKEAAQTKEDKELFRVCGLKEEVIEEKRRIAGYAALVYEHPKGENAQKLTDEEVLNAYHRLVGIEDCFRTMKTCFSIRPVHVWLPSHVTAHCYLCVFALMMMKILQEKLDKQESSLTPGQITEALASAYVLPIPSTEGKGLNFLNLGLGEAFHAPAFTGKGKIQAKENELEDSEKTWSAYHSYRTETPFAMDRILEAVGLKRLEINNPMKGLKEKLGILSVSPEFLISPEQAAYEKIVNRKLIQ